MLSCLSQFWPKTAWKWISAERDGRIPSNPWIRYWLWYFLYIRLRTFLIPFLNVQSIFLIGLADKWVEKSGQMQGHLLFQIWQNFLHCCQIGFFLPPANERLYLCPGESLSKGSFSRGSLSGKSSVQGDLCLGESLSRGRGSLSRGVSVQGDLCPEVSLSRGSLSRGSLSGGSLSRGSLSGKSLSRGGVYVWGERSLSRGSSFWGSVLSRGGLSIWGRSLWPRGMSVQEISVQWGLCHGNPRLLP